MKFTKIAAALTVAFLSTGIAGAANATVLTFDLTDTQRNANGLQNGGFYQFTGGHPNFDSLSFEQNGAGITLRYDEHANTAQINGTGFNLDTGQIAEFNLFYDDITRDGNLVTFNDRDTVGAIAGQTVNGSGFNLNLIGDSLTGDGWLSNLDGTHFGDFHFVGSQVSNGGGGEVPAPAPLSLIAAMALFGAWRRKRSIAG